VRNVTEGWCPWLRVLRVDSEFQPSAQSQSPGDRQANGKTRQSARSAASGESSTEDLTDSM
jgi:hypothetical protein